jgi:glutathione peroxidase
MQTSKMLLPVVVAVVLAGAVTAAGCNAASSDPAPAGGTQTPGAGNGGNTAAVPSAPPTGSPEGPAAPTPVDPTNDPSLKACTGTAGQLSALHAKKLTVGDDVPLCKFDGNVLMIVNTASMCGNTPQYAPLQTLYDKYRAQGFYILGFPSPQFGGQEYATDQQVTAFCTSTYHITFPMFEIGDVNGAAMQPVYQWIHAQPGTANYPPPPAGSPPSGYDRPVQWNFEKFLVDRKGKVVLRVENGTYPDDPAVVAAIEAELAKP